MSIEYSIDRFEGNFAVLENRESLEMINVKRNEIPNDAKEWNILFYKNNIYKIDRIKTINIKSQMKNLLNSLFNK